MPNAFILNVTVFSSIHPYYHNPPLKIVTYATPPPPQKKWEIQINDFYQNLLF